MKQKSLSSAEVKKRQIQYGKNVLPEEKTIPAIRIFFSQFANPLVYILCSAGLISLFLQKYFDIALIFSVVFINAVMGFFQENKTQKTLVALKKLVKPYARVLRDETRQEIDALELVPGDIVFLAIGDRVPADGRILEEVSFFTNEAVLTGESEAVPKKEDSEVVSKLMEEGSEIWERGYYRRSRSKDGDIMGLVGDLAGDQIRADGVKPDDNTGWDNVAEK